MRIIFIGMTYLLRINRQKLNHLASLPDVELHLVVPVEWPHLLKKYTIEIESNTPYKLYPTQTLFQGHESRYIYFPNLASHINTIKPDIIHVEQGSHALSYTQSILAKKIFTPQAKCLFFTWWNLEYNFRFYWQIIEKFNLAHSDYAITGNHDAQSILRQKGFQKPIKILPQLGVDPDVYTKRDVSQLRQELGLSAFTIGFVGRLVEQKGLFTLLYAVSKLRQDCHLLLVGRGPLKSELIRLATTLNIADKTIFVDTVPHDEVPLYLNCMDVMVLPSLTTNTWKEQFGHVLIEAMACQTPVIGSSSGEIPNVIADAGLVFEEGDADDLFQKIQTLLDAPELKTQLAQKGMERVLAHYTHQHIAEETYQIYQDLLSTPE